MHIAFLDSWLQSAAEGSGTAVGIGGLAQALLEDGHVVERIVPPPWRMPITWRRLLFNATLSRRLQAATYDLVVGFDFDGVWWARRSTEPYICSIKGVIAEELQHEQGRNRLLFTLLARLEGANARQADRVITTSEYCRQRIAQHYHVPVERIGIVAEGIDVQAWEQTLRGVPVRTDPDPTILCVARQYPRKHIADLLYAFASLRKYMPEVRLRLVGDGPEHDNLRALAARLNLGSAVTFLGSIPDADVKREYAHCDVFCLPSIQEGFGIVFLEAMVAGKPVVATTAAAIPEVVQHGRTGILVPPGDPQSLAGALLLLLSDVDRRMQYGQAGQDAVLRYDWSRIVETFLREVEHVQ